jgi:hypothetical protein
VDFEDEYYTMLPTGATGAPISAGVVFVKIFQYVKFSKSATPI